VFKAIKAAVDFEAQEPSLCSKKEEKYLDEGLSEGF